MNTFKKVKNFLRSKDYFGHPVALNFNRNGNYHTTPFGGFVSIMLRIIYYSYMIHLLMIMFTYNDDRTFVSNYEIKNRRVHF